MVYLRQCSEVAGWMLRWPLGVGLRLVGGWLQGGWAQRGETGFALKRGHAVWKQSPTATMRPQGGMMAASFRRVHAYAYGRGNVSQSGMGKGLLVVYEWKFDGGTTVPPFASKFRDSSIGNSQQPFRFRDCSLVC